MPQETHPLRATTWPLLQEQLSAERQWPGRLAHFLKQFSSVSQSQSLPRGGEVVVPVLRVSQSIGHVMRFNLQ